MITANIGTAQYAVQLTNSRHVFSADEPLDKGGRDAGPTPDELLEAALASCTSITLRMYIDRKGWKVDAIKVMVRMDRTEDKTNFAREIILTGDVSEEQRTRLLQIAKACPVSKTLHGVIEVNSSIV